jgi:hypothetical protein
MAVANNMSNSLSATIIATEDTTGNVPINRGLGNLSFDSIFAEFTAYQNLSNGDNVITLPDSPAYQVYVKNNGASGNIIVKYTPQGGAQQVSPVLGPGEIFLIWQANNSAANPTAGITALIVNASTANIPIEYFIGG